MKLNKQHLRTIKSRMKSGPLTVETLRFIEEEYLDTLLTIAIFFCVEDKKLNK